MGEFQEIASEFAGLIEESKHEKGIRSDDLADIIGRIAGHWGGKINCYPGIRGFDCFDIAYFISLTAPSHKDKKGHLTCGQAMEKIVQHMQGGCLGETRRAVFLTDNWDPAAYEAWKVNFRQIKDGALLEAYLLTGRNASEIKL